SHPILAKCDAMTARREVADCKTLLQRRLGRPVRHLAYPFGDPSAIGVRECRLAQQAGYVTAMSSRPGHVFPNHAGLLHALPRVSINGLFQNKTALRSLLSGAPFWIWNRSRVVTIEPQLCDRIPIEPALQHDPEKACPGLDPGWVPVFGKRSCSTKKLERDDDSKKSHPALARSTRIFRWGPFRTAIDRTLNARYGQRLHLQWQPHGRATSRFLRNEGKSGVAV